jgi:hypothetical protein
VVVAVKQAPRLVEVAVRAAVLAAQQAILRQAVVPGVLELQGKEMLAVEQTVLMLVQVVVAAQEQLVEMAAFQLAQVAVQELHHL